MNVWDLSSMSDSQTSFFFEHVINNLNVFGTRCVFGASWTMLILDTVSPAFELGSQLFTTLYRRALSPDVESISWWIALPDIPWRNRYFITARFFKFIHSCDVRTFWTLFNQSIIYLIQATRPIKRTNIKRKSKTDRQKEEDRDILHYKIYTETVRSATTKALLHKHHRE